MSPQIVYAAPDRSCLFACILVKLDGKFIELSCELDYLVVKKL